MGVCNQAAGVVTCSLAALAVGGAPDITIVVTAPNNGGLITNTATVTSATGDPDSGNNAETAQTTVIPPAVPQADLSIVKTDSPDPVVAGGMLTYTIGITNNGPDAANNAVSERHASPWGYVYECIWLRVDLRIFGRCGHMHQSCRGGWSGPGLPLPL